MCTSPPRALPGSIWSNDGLPPSLKNRSAEGPTAARGSWRRQSKTISRSITQIRNRLCGRKQRTKSLHPSHAIVNGLMTQDTRGSEDDGAPGIPLRGHRRLLPGALRGHPAGQDPGLGQGLSGAGPEGVPLHHRAVRYRQRQGVQRGPHASCLYEALCGEPDRTALHPGAQSQNQRQGRAGHQNAHGSLARQDPV